jgi:Ribbon-helix-helix domain
MNSPDTPIKPRPIGRPPTGIVNPVIVGTRVSPQTYEALTRESERRRVKPAVLIREALDLLLRDAEHRHLAA